MMNQIGMVTQVLRTMSQMTDNLHSSTPYTGKSQVTMGNGQGAKIKSIGKSVFTSPIHPHINLVLNNLLHVPNITKNLLSVSRFSKDNQVSFEFNGANCLVKSRGSNRVVLEGTLEKDGIFKGLPIARKHKTHLVLPTKHTTSFNFVSTNSLSVDTACNSRTTNTLSLWHARLGHANSHVVSHVLKL